MKTHLIILSIAFILHSYHAGSQCNQSQNVGLFYGNNNGNESIDLMLGVRKLGNGNNATCSENFRFITSFANGVANFKNWTHASNAWHTFIRDGANGGLNMARVGGNPTENVFILFDAAINDNVKIKFSSNANSYLNSGNLGIGTQSPTGRLHILGDPSDNDAGLTSPGGYLVLGSTTGPNLALDNNEIMARSNGVMTSLGLQADGGAIMIHGSSANESEKVLINSAGLVGIGNTNPQAYLHIKQAPDKPYAIKLERPGAGHVPYELFIGSSKGLNIKNSQTGNVDMVFGGNQTIGIGTLAPQALLHLKQYDQKGLRFERDGYKKYELRLDNSNGLHIFNVDDSRDEMVFDGNGNVGIGTTSPNISATLEIQSTNKGVLIPRLTTAQRTAIASPAGGLLVYDSDLQSFFYFNGTTWTQFIAGSNDDADANPANELQTISKTGNTVTLSHSGGSFTDEVDDADPSPTNELQTISKSGNTITLSNNGGSFTDEVNDADAVVGNEYNTGINLTGNTLNIVDGGGTHSVDLSSLIGTGTETDPEVDEENMSAHYLSKWNGSALVQSNSVFEKVGGDIGIGTTDPVVKLQVVGEESSSINTGVLKLTTASSNTNMVLDGNEINSYSTLSINNNSGDDILMVGGSSGGQVGIGVSSDAALPDDLNYKLAVNGRIIASEVKVQSIGNWPDHVFEKDYPLLPLAELEKSIQQNGHLPGIPSAAEVQTNGGVEVGDMQRRLLEKVEEMTLYIIELEKRIKELEEKK